MKNLIPAILLWVGLSSCLPPGSPVDDSGLPKIRPLLRTEYREGETVVFRSDDTASPGEMVWNSSLQGELGKGSFLSVTLKPGIHQISLVTSGRVCDSLTLTVKELVFVPGTSLVQVLNRSESQVILPSGTYCPILVNLESTSVSLSLTPGAGVTEAGAGAFRTLPEGPEWESLRAHHFLPSLPKVSLFRKAPGSTGRGLEGERTFIMADTTGKKSEGHRIQGKVVFEGEFLKVYLDANSGAAVEGIQSLARELEDLFIPRFMALWGSHWADLDGDGKLGVLISPQINLESKAVGFFNPSDFFPYEDNLDSDEYNIITNHMDIVYLADPTASPGVFAYSANSVKATLVHELTHLFSFSHRVMLPLEAGYHDWNAEELFLDEGLAHLTESLCGLGESGGNLAFLSVYLQKPWTTALRGPDADGSPDSASKRGMAAGFLSWLFWKSGGMDWDADDPGKLVDKGGILFLRRLLSQSKTGLDNISLSAGASSPLLLMEWVQAVGSQDAGTGVYFSSRKDPVTGEEVTMNPFHGDLLLNGKNYPLKGPVKLSLAGQVTLPPYAAQWGNQLQVLEKSTLKVTAGNPVPGSFYGIFLMK